MRRSSQASGWICSSTRSASSRRCATVRSSGTPFARQRSSMRPEPRAEGHRWLAQAENDLRFAELASQERFFAQACFNSQQAAEKALEAFLYARGAEQVMGHSVADHREGRAARGGERFADLGCATPGALGKQALEEARVEFVRIDHHTQARAQARPLDAPAVVQHRFRARHEPRVTELALEVERHLPRDHLLLTASDDDLPRLIHELDAQYDARRDIRRERVADTRVL